jgi:ATP-dependent RNA helicase DeaD
LHVLFPNKDAKESKAILSRIFSSCTHVRTYLISVSSIASVSYGLLLVLSSWYWNPGELSGAHKGALAERIFMLSFNDFFLQPATREVLANMEIVEPTPVQIEAIPALLAGKDVTGLSATGSGKTLAYGIPVVERLAREKRVVQALVLVPTRELALQVNAVLSQLASGRRLSTALLVGGRAFGSQLSALRYGAQIVVGTPGRVKDHLDRGSLVLNQLRMCVLDEADQMLDSGFAPIVEEILASTPETRQMALFSATMPDWVEALQQKFLKDPVKVEIMLASGVPSTIEQIAYQVPQEQKLAALCTLLHSMQGESSLIFGKTKYGVEKLGNQLSKLGFTVQTLHGNKSQSAREKVLTAFRRGQVQTLLATNVAARGLDITGIDQVINYELPESSELFTHRIGRTGRMGRQGKAITLLVPSDIPKWRRMVHHLGQGVALQKLAIDMEAFMTFPPARPEAARKQEDEQKGEPRGRLVPERRFSGKQKDGKRDVEEQEQSRRSTRKHEARALAVNASQPRTARKGPGAKRRWTSASSRSTGR